MIIKATLENFKEQAVILKTEDNLPIIWPKNKLPTDLKIGSVLIFSILGDSIIDEDNTKIAKNILNEILS